MKLFVLLLIVSLLAANILATPEDDLRSGNVAFTNKVLYKGMVLSPFWYPYDNIVLSPFPVQTTMAALASGAYNNDDRVVQEIRNVMSLPQTNSTREQAFQSILAEVSQSDDNFKIYDAFKMYFSKDIDVERWYRDLVQRAYHTEIGNINFWKDNVFHIFPNPVKEINSWVSQKTNGGITNFLDHDLPVYDNGHPVKNILVNALYLKGKWVKPFSKTATVKRKFYGPKLWPTVDMMTNDASYEYREDTKAQYLRMDLLKSKGNAYVEFILPINSSGMEPAYVPFSISPQSYPLAKVNVTLPRLSITSDWDLSGALADIGARHAFTDGLRLKGLSSPDNIRVSAVYQKSIISVSEWGICADSAAAPPPINVDEPQDTKQFLADHPFAFQVVVDNILAFVGHVTDPTQFE